MKTRFQKILLLIFTIVIGFIGYNLYLISSRLPERAYSRFLLDIEQEQIEKVSIRDGIVTGTDRDGTVFTTFSPDVPGLIPLLTEQAVEISTSPPAKISQFMHDLLIVLLLLGGWAILSGKTRSESASFLQRSRFKSAGSNNSKITFNDVAGISEASEELREITSFLKNPRQFTTLGGRIPKGVLLEGPPGTGKTLLAKAIAGEASVPFYPLGGSDFVEMFAGLGASRVRDLFTEAKKHAPAIIFIDEIDAIGGKRSSTNQSGSNDEREQTLNALLVELDGFSSNETVIVIAATNRADILDSALLRPGRFDRQITLTLPDIKGRLKILEVHCRKVTIDENIDLALLARSIPGFSGAQIANLVNEAALLAARKKKQHIETDDFEEAKDKIIMGLERKSAVISEKSRRLAAYHEAGHAVMALMLPETDPLHKITIIPRGRALGLTQQLPFDEHLTFSRTYLINRIKILMGGRLAEELIFNVQTTGAGNDIITATDIAYRIVCDFGMSGQLGPVSYSGVSSAYQGESAHPHMLSEQTLREINLEVKNLIDECCRKTSEILEKHNTFLHMLAESVLANETLDGEEIDIVYRCYSNQKSIEKEYQLDEKTRET
ncbi:MAG: ATP-dependent zinc metalloprotease FtsH [Desulfocapsaceae bacterium]|jgi:cell division protease FtsH|nr:ATP-dependent zinc metalloprotease FtsH [Desulfocapsaceae bacterium]